MAIIRSINEVKLLLPRLLSALSNNALLPNMDVAAEKHLVPVVGSDFYTEIQTAYMAQTFTADQAAILPKMQLVVATGAFLDELAFSQASITDQGIRTAQTQNMPRVYGWEFKELKTGLQNRQWDAVDTLLQYLVANKSHFPAWATSDAFTQFDQCLIKTAIEFNNIHRLVQPFRMFYALKPLMMDVQEQQLVPTIGRALFDRFNTATDLADAEKIIKQQLKKAVAFLTIQKACSQFAVQFDTNGFSIVGSGDAEGETAGRTGDVGGRIKMKMDASGEDGNDWLAVARLGIWKFSNNTDAGAEFMEAMTTSPLVGYVPPSQRESGNAFRRIFRF